MASWYTAPSLISLRNELNAANPKRDTSADGFVGDTAHSARVSDHNPDWSAGGVVRAGDFDKDGIDTNKLLAIAIADPRVEYVIWAGHIYRRATGFKKEVYKGSNGHYGHMHISLRHTKSAEKSGRWGYTATSPSPSPTPTPGGLLPLDQIARQVIAGAWGSGDDRKARLRAKGYDPAAVQAEVNRQLGAKPAPVRKSNDEIAREVLAGHWGNNPERSQKLQAAGYSPTDIQAAVNRLVGGSKPVVVRDSISAVADQVIRGQWGKGLERRQRLAAAGYNPDAVQAEVNRKLA
jgi:hypothetical protein